jgi:hypothetical protein
MFVFTQSQILSAVSSFTSSLASGATVHLYTNAYSPTNLSTIGSFTEADFTGYSAVTITGYTSAAWQSQGAGISYTQPQAVFNTASPYTVGQNIVGYWVQYTATPPVLVGAERFAAAIPMSAAGNQIIIVAPLSFADAGAAGQVF